MEGTTSDSKGQEPDVGSGLQGVRHAKLQRALDRALEKTLEKCTTEVFLESFQPLLYVPLEKDEEDQKGRKGKKARKTKKEEPEKNDEAERVLLEARDKVLTNISTTIKEEFNATCGRWDVAEKLLLLDQYAEQLEQRDIKQRSLQPLKVSPLKLGLSIEGELKQQEKDLLLQAVKELEEENRQLRDELMAKRQQQEQYLHTFELGTSQLGKAALLCRDWAKSDARRWMEQELAASRPASEQ